MITPFPACFLTLSSSDLLFTLVVEFAHGLIIVLIPNFDQYQNQTCFIPFFIIEGIIVYQVNKIAHFTLFLPWQYSLLTNDNMNNVIHIIKA